MAARLWISSTVSAGNCSSVRARHSVELIYGGGDARVVHPHAVYRTERGRLCLDAVQVAGPTSGPLPAWRQFSLMKVVDLRVLDGHFTVAGDYDRRSPKYASGLLASA